jgi:hypothetical protein
MTVLPGPSGVMPLVTGAGLDDKPALVYETDRH